MDRKKALNRRRALALIMSAVLIVFILFASLFIIIESDHDCTGEHCPVCEYLHVCTGILSTLHVLLFKVSVSGASVMMFVLLLYVSGVLIQENPVRDKVRMNN